MKVYCRFCGKMNYLTKPTSAGFRCCFCHARINGRKQREIAAELNKLMQAEIPAVVETVGEVRKIVIGDNGEPIQR